MALEGTLLVSTEELRSKSETVRQQLDQITAHFDRLRQLSAGTTSCWTGDASDAHRQAYLRHINRIESMLSRYQEHVTDLQTMAGIYEAGESTAVQAADTLPAIDL